MKWQIINIKIKNERDNNATTITNAKKCKKKGRKTNDKRKLRRGKKKTKSSGLLTNQKKKNRGVCCLSLKKVSQKKKFFFHGELVPMNKLLLFTFSATVFHRSTNGNKQTNETQRILPIIKSIEFSSKFLGNKKTRNFVFPLILTNDNHFQISNQQTKFIYSSVP